jgi:hypothetical protein
MEEADAEGASNDEPDYSSVGSYEVQNGWEVLDDPAPTSEELDAMKEIYVWTNKRLVHIWEMPFGWNFRLSTTRPLRLRAESWSSFSFMGAQGRCSATTWNLKKNGTEGEWVIIQKVSK